MKVRSVLWLFVVVALALTSAAQTAKSKPAGGSSSAIEKQVRDLEEQARASALKNETSFLEKHLADNYVGTSPDGHRMGKSDSISMRKDGKVKYESIDVSDMDVKVYNNDTAIVSGAANVKMTLDGQDRSGQYRITRVWVKQGGNWKIAAFQSTRAAEQTAAAAK